MSHEAPPQRQTLSYLRDMLAAHGISPRNKLGQNFLIDLNLLDLVVRAAELSPADLVLEVGSGTGTLTGRLAALAGAVLSVEVDRDFYELARQHTAGRENVVLVHADILRRKNELNPGVLERLGEMRARPGIEQLKLVANLPYAVATPVISNFLLSDFSFERMVVMVQLEIADRLMARPKTKEYSSLAVLVQSVADVEPVRRRVPPTVFWPRPHVASAIMMVRPNAQKRAHVVERLGSVVRLRNFLRDLYTQRRKNLRGALSGLPSGRRDKTEVDATLAQLGINAQARAEDLDVDSHLRLCEAFG